MTDNLEELPVSSIESSSETIDVTEKGMMKDFMVEQKEINKKLIENQQKILEKLQSNEDEKSGRKRGREVNDNPIENVVKKVDTVVSKEKVSDESQNPIFEKFGKYFTMKHTFKDVSKMEEDGEGCIDNEEHFGVFWNMSIHRNKEHLAFYTWCANEDAKGVWSIEVDYEVKLLSEDGNPDVRKSVHMFKQDEIEQVKEFDSLSWDAFIKLEDLDKKYSNDNSLTFEVYFKIKTMTGIYKDDLRSFDDPECSDIVLVVNDKKFYVAKLFLATHSSYFKVMFLGMFNDSNKSEITLTGIDADDFQNYLEVLYGDYAIDKYTVEGILMVADMYDTQIVITKCEEFLLKESEKTLKKMLELSVRYNLDQLKKRCLSEINTPDDIRTVLPTNIRDLDHSLLADLLEKVLATS